MTASVRLRHRPYGLTPLHYHRDETGAKQFRRRDKMSTLAHLRGALFLSLWAAMARAEPAQPILAPHCGRRHEAFYRRGTAIADRSRQHSNPAPPRLRRIVDPSSGAVARSPRRLAARKIRSARGERQGWLRRANSADADRGRQTRRFGCVDRRRAASHPWPKLPAKDVSAGPFYLIWQYPERSHVSNEQWPYMLEKLTVMQSPELRWPQLKVNAPLPAGAPARRGEEVSPPSVFPVIA